MRAFRGACSGPLLLRCKGNHFEILRWLMANYPRVFDRQALVNGTTYRAETRAFIQQWVDQVRV